jgi:flagellar motor switch protein FliN/FliY
MGEEEKKNQEEEIDQEALAEEWAKMAESEEKEETDSEEVDQEKLAEEWAKMAEQSEDKKEELNQEISAEEWEQTAESKEKIEEKIKKIEGPTGIEQEKLDLLMDIPLEVSVEIGSTHLPLEEILKLNPNNIVELDKFINQPVDLKVNGKLIAKGELYTVEDHFGIKITSIITVQERMKLLTEEQE